MRATLRTSAAALAILFLPGVGSTEVMDNELEKLPEVRVVVAPLSEAAAECNVTTNGLDAAARVTLDASRLRVREESPDRSFLLVYFFARSADSGCTGYLEVALARPVIVVSTEKPTIAKVWSRNFLMAGPAYDFGERVNATVREFTTQFLAEWIKQNPKQ